jgi:hypothetical protein
MTVVFRLEIRILNTDKSCKYIKAYENNHGVLPSIEDHVVLKGILVEVENRTFHYDDDQVILDCRPEIYNSEYEYKKLISILELGKWQREAE